MSVTGLPELGAAELDESNPNVTPRSGSVQENDTQDASGLDTSSATRIEDIGSGIEIESITFEPPGSGWAFKKFSSSPNYVDVIPTSLDVISPTIVLQSPSAIRVMWTVSDIDPTADGWPLRAEGNLKRPTGGGGGGSIPDFHWAALINASFIDLDVDSDHTTRPQVYPDPAVNDRGEEEDSIEESSPAPVHVNNADTDRDDVPGYADGINKHGHAGSGTTIPFTKAILRVILPPGSTSPTIEFAYTDSDPDAVTQTSHTSPASEQNIYSPATGKMRIWTVDGPSSRDVATVDNGGDFVPSGVQIDHGDFSWNAEDETTLYLEGVDLDSIGTTTTVVVTVDPDGSGPEAGISDTVLVEFFPVQGYNVGNTTTLLDSEPH